MSTITTIEEIEAEGKRAESMKRRLHSFVEQGVPKQIRMLEVICGRTVTNKLPLPHTLRVKLTPNKGELRLVACNPDEPKQTFDAILHQNALQQMTNNPPDIKLSMRDIRWMLSGQLERQELVPHVLNTLFEHETFTTGKSRKRIKRFLVRLVKEKGADKEEIRAFLSDKFGVTYDTRALLRAFIESCKSVKAGPVAAYYDDLKVSLTCCLPYVFEPVDKSFVAIGVNFTNSDFGRGAFSISTVAFSVLGGTTSILEHDYSRRHIGSVLQCTELESSAEFKKAEVEAQSQAVRDLVPRALSLPSIKNTLELIQFAHEKRIPWYKADQMLKAMTLLKEERERVRELLSGPPMEELPSPSKDDDGDPQANAWWLANAVGWLAENELQEKAHDLQLAAGKLLGKVEDE